MWGLGYVGAGLREYDGTSWGLGYELEYEGVSMVRYDVGTYEGGAVGDVVDDCVAGVEFVTPEGGRTCKSRGDR